jgi:hypothetical protein
MDHTAATVADALNNGSEESAGGTVTAAKSNVSVYDRGKWGVDINHVNTLKQGPLFTAVHRYQLICITTVVQPHNHVLTYLT